MLFPKNSAFTPTEQQTEYLESVRQRALNQVETLPNEDKARLEALASEAREILESVQDRPPHK